MQVVQEPSLLNVFWTALVGAQAELAVGTGSVRRFRRGLPAIAGSADPSALDFAALAAVTDVGERLYVAHWRGEPVPEWAVVAEAPCYQMVWAAPAPVIPVTPGVRELRPEDAAQMQALLRQTQPGPTGLDQLALGTYLGVWYDDRLVALAGQRLQTQTAAEVSAICTAPDSRGQGLAGLLTLHMVERILRAGKLPFLHVLASNRTAIALYERLGFVVVAEPYLRVVQRIA